MKNILFLFIMFLAFSCGAPVAEKEPEPAPQPKPSAVAVARWENILCRRTGNHAIILLRVPCSCRLYQVRGRTKGKQCKGAGSKLDNAAALRGANECS